MWKRFLDWLLGRKPQATPPAAHVASPAKPAPAPAAVPDAAVAPPDPASAQWLFDDFESLLFGGGGVPAVEQLKPVERQVYGIVEAQLRAGLAPEALPKLPMTVGLLLRELQDPQGSQRRIEDLVRRDPALAGDVLRIANSPAYRVSDTPIASIEGALRLIGQETLKSIVVAVLMRPVIHIQPIYFLMFGSFLWDQAMASALAARQLARDGQELDPFVAYFTGLSHNVGRIAIFRMVADNFNQLGAEMPPRPDVFRLLMGAYGSLLSASIVRHWGVGMDLPVAIHDQSRVAAGEAVERMSPLGELLFRARLLACAALLKREGQVAPERIEAALAGYGLQLCQCPELSGLGRA